MAALLVLPMAIPPAQADFSIRANTIGGITYVRAADVARYYGLRLWANGEKAIIHDERAGFGRSASARLVEVVDVFFFVWRCEIAAKGLLEIVNHNAGVGFPKRGWAAPGDLRDLGFGVVMFVFDIANDRFDQIL